MTSPVLPPLCLNESTLWRVLRVETRREGAVQALLVHNGIVGYTPLYTEKRKWSQNRIGEIQVSLFPGYVFAQFPVERARSIRDEIPWIHGVLEFGGHSAELADSEIQRIRLMTLGENILAQDGIAVGRRVRVVKGPMTGLEGVVARVGGVDRVWLSVEVFNRSVGAEFDRWSIVPLKSGKC